MLNRRSIYIFIFSVLLLVTLYVPGVCTAAPLLMDETFDSAIPAGWTQIRYSGDGLWEWTTTSSTAPTDPAEGGFLVADSDKNSGYVYDVGLFTPSMDMSGLTSVQIAFDKNFEVFGIYGEAHVATYSGGTDAVHQEEVLEFWDTDDNSAESYTIDPSAYTYPSDVYVEFWYSTEDDTWAWGFSIDNLTIGEATTPLTVEITYFVIDHCTGTIDVTATATGGDGNYTYDWDIDNDGTYDVIDTGMTTTLSPGFGTESTAFVRVTDGSESTNTDMHTYIINPQITVVLTVEYEPGTANFTANATGGDGNYTYDWDIDNDGTYEISGIVSQTQVLKIPGAFGTVHVRARDGEGCMVEDWCNYEIKILWSPIITQPLARTQLDSIILLWENLLGKLPEEPNGETAALIEQIQRYVGNAAQLTNPIFVSGQLSKASDAIQQLTVMLT